VKLKVLSAVYFEQGVGPDDFRTYFPVSFYDFTALNINKLYKEIGFSIFFEGLCKENRKTLKLPFP